MDATPGPVEAQQPPAGVTMRDKVAELRQLMATLPQVQLETQHLFADGMYCRVLPRPAGTTIVGKVHKRAHFYVVAAGRVAVVNVSDGSRTEYGPGSVVVSQPGTQRAVVALEDSICLTVHRTDKHDLDEIEAELIEPDDAALFDSRNQLKFDVPAFRELTQRVIAAEKPGFWSDWTPEQQALYTAGTWEAFSESRGYSTEEIADYRRWRDQIEQAQSVGLNPYAFIADLAAEAALRNVESDGRGEILKSSHAPFEDRGEAT